MPTVLISGPYRFHFWSYDCDEPRHIHVQRDNKRAKFWLEPVLLEDSYGFRGKELREIERIIVANRTLLQEAWDEHCARA
ncbi:MAG TPA: DUF4160 domain-containing protein [Chloroflexi bacterium]|nr:DUF4160 domain-containing protein [Chloroflexota bacterium]